MVESTSNYYWANRVNPATYAKLTESLEVDVCIVGGGFTGVSAALNLVEKGYKVALLESHFIGWGASGRNGGQASGEPRHDQVSLERKLGHTLAHQHWQLNNEALQYLKACINDYQIDCDWVASGILEVAHKKRYARFFKTYAEHLHQHYQCGYLDYLNADQASDKAGSAFYAGLLNHQNGHLNPFKLVRALAKVAHQKGLLIYENSPVIRYHKKQNYSVITEKGRVVATYLVFACNAYMGDLDQSLAKKIMPINNFIAVTEPLKQAPIRDKLALVDSRFVVNYWRMLNDGRLLFGGGESYSYRYPTEARTKQIVQKRLLKVYPQLKGTKIDYAWGGTLAITLNRFPHFGRGQDNSYFAQGYSGHGVALSVFAGKLIAQALSGEAQKFDIFTQIKIPDFPGGSLLRWPALVTGMLWYQLLDKLG